MSFVNGLPPHLPVVLYSILFRISAIPLSKYRPVEYASNTFAIRHIDVCEQYNWLLNSSSNRKTKHSLPLFGMFQVKLTMPRFSMTFKGSRNDHNWHDFGLIWERMVKVASTRRIPGGY